MSFIAKSLVAISIMAAPSAYSADLANYNAQQFDYTSPPAFSWNGAYIGAHGGVVSPKVNPLASGRGLTGGVQAGYNFQFGSGVVGAELEGSYLGNEARVPNGRLRERFRGAAKLKAGVALDRTLLYGTAGLTTTKFKDGNGVTGPDDWKRGYLVGAGVEQSFGGGLSAKFEYNYVNTGNVSTTTSSGRSKTDVSDHVVKAGLNYRF
ncbi:outer membrane protein [Agrobacterium pusense]|uniref:outer membrane protein n=1 Tax=Agrobacterium pusense TaxID=648995 RepID=UPI002FDE7902